MNHIETKTNHVHVIPQHKPQRLAKVSSMALTYWAWSHVEGRSMRQVNILQSKWLTEPYRLCWARWKMLGLINLEGEVTVSSLLQQLSFIIYDWINQTEKN